MIPFKQFIHETTFDIKNTNFRKWFKNSKVVDEKGNPLVVFHGSGVSIKEFSHEFIGKGNDQAGSGFYFTTCETEARGYTQKTKEEEEKFGKAVAPTVHACFLSIQKPLDSAKIGTLSSLKVRQLIMLSPILNDALSDWGDIEYEGKNKVLNKAIENYTFKNENILQHLFLISNDFYKSYVKEFNIAVKKVLGYDGILVRGDEQNNWFSENGVNHWVAFFPWQIKHVDAINFNINSNNIYESLLIENNIIDDWSVDPEDVPIGKWAGRIVFHGTDAKAAKDILTKGIDNSKSSKGYFGRGFYCASDYNLAKSNYADFRDDGEIPEVIAVKINPKARILDMRNGNEWEWYSKMKLDRYLSNDDCDKIMVRYGVDGLFDRSFGGVVIYNTKMVTPIKL